MSSHAPSAAPARCGEPAPLGRRLVLLLALTCGVAVGNLYFPQAVGPLVADGLGVSPGTAALVATAAQFGYAAGNFLLVPLGDRIPHRTLIVVLLVLTGIGLLAAAGSPALPPLLGASAFVGITTVVAQVIAPMAAGLVADERRGAVLGTLLSGSIGGMLLARAFGGVVGDRLGWRGPYVVSAAAALVLAAVLAAALPVARPPARVPYRTLLAAAPRLLRREPALRRSCLYQAAVFGGFQAVWTGAALYLTGPEYRLGASAVGVLALVGGVTMACTPAAGRLVDRRGADAVSLAAIAGTIAAAGVLALGVLGGTAGLVALGAGTLLLDVAMQAGMVANQARIFALRPDARSRINTAYMTCAFLGGSAGSWLGARAHAAFGWPGVCGLVAALAAAALARHLHHLWSSHYR
ncbi:MFS transporter [Actinomadura rifamycini]|uniref:MFS transporter n=1 Tax=Actinomadura rifamycini TaxID=31962 RepID=UPI0003F842FB|nr:MFS transporter [Actinomadura rifamycini]